MGSAEVLVAPTEKVQFMEDMKTEVKLNSAHDVLCYIFCGWSLLARSA